MTTKTEMLISKNVLKAALTHASKNDCRYYLEGVHIDRATGHVVATDGHRMFVARLAKDTWSSGASFTIPRKMLETAIKMSGKCDVITVTFEQTERPDPERDGVTIVSAPVISVDGITGAPIDGKYPDWRRVAPATVSGEPSTYNPEYLLAAHKALDMACGRGGQPYCNEMSTNGNAPGVLTCADGDAAVVIMPMRVDTLSPEKLAARIKAVY